MSNSLDKFIAIKTEDGKVEEVMGKYMYYSLPKLVVKVEKIKEICETIGFPVDISEKVSLTDAFRSATSEIHHRIEDDVNGELRIVKVYCRDNKKGVIDLLSRELVEETLDEKTNSYKKLANITLDKNSGQLMISDIDVTSKRDIYGYFEEAKFYFKLYQECLGNRSIETIADKYISSMNATSISARGHHYFIPKAYMHKISLLEDFMELVGKENLFSYSDKRDSTYISINSMYVADNEKQRNKMAHEFYIDMAKEIDEYQSRIINLIKSGSKSQRVLDRWELKIQSLESKKREYEKILKRNLSNVDDEFSMLRGIYDNLKMSVKNTQIFGVAA